MAGAREADSRLNHVIKGRCGTAICVIQGFLHSPVLPPLPQVRARVAVRVIFDVVVRVRARVAVRARVEVRIRVGVGVRICRNFLRVALAWLLKSARSLARSSALPMSRAPRFVLIIRLAVSLHRFWRLTWDRLGSAKGQGKGLG